MAVEEGLDRLGERKWLRLEIILRQCRCRPGSLSVFATLLLCSLSTHTSLIPHHTSLHPIHSLSHPFSEHMLDLLSNTDDTASRTATRVARGLTLLVSALAQIVRASVHDDSPTQHALGTDQLDLLVRDGALRVALAVRLEVAEVADVAFAVRGGAVGLRERVDWVAEKAVSAGRRLRIESSMGGGEGGVLTVRSSACAAIGVVTELVDVHAALGRGIVARDVVRDGCRGGLG